MKAVKAKLTEQGKSADEISAFEKGAQAFAKKVIANFKDYEFLIGESMDPDSMYVDPDVAYGRKLTVIGSSSSTTVKMEPRPMSPCGSMV
jgi:hypothetical protein